MGIHIQSDRVQVHFSSAFLHLHLLPQPFLYLQELNSEHQFEASGSVVHNSSYCPSFSTHPQSHGDRSIHCGIKTLSPEITTLVRASFHMLFKSCQCWRYSLYLQNLFLSVMTLKHVLIRPYSSNECE